jgi:uncharacterized protein with von Willebrand factor type A (vWA) domain
VDSLVFAFEHGEFVREQPAMIRAVLDSQYPGASPKRRKRMQQKARRALLRKMERSFLEGAGQAHDYFQRHENQAHVRQLFEEHDGKPVGWKRDQKDVWKEVGEKPRTQNRINGAHQEIIAKGPACGMFLLEAKEAFKNFLDQLREKPIAFWKRAFRIAPTKEDHAFAY